MPLNVKGRKIKASMIQQYGAEKGKQVFYASENKGTIKGVKAVMRSTHSPDSCTPQGQTLVG